MPCVQSKLFDHKPIILSFDKREKNISIPKVSNKMLAMADFDLVVWTAIADAYVSHVSVDFNIEITNDYRARVGRVKFLLRLAGPDPNIMSVSELEKINIDDRNENIRLAREVCNTLNIEDLEAMPLGVDDDIFMEVLLNSIKNDVISYQSFIFKTLKENREIDLASLNNLKTDYILNQDLISKLEQKISLQLDVEMRQSLENNIAYDILHAEKITPTFLKLLKVNKDEGRIRDIADDSGTAFASEREREEYIVKFYENLYKRDENIIRHENSIEEFLGDNLCNHPLVLGCKLSEGEKANFEQPFSLLELDRSLEGSNMKSAPGEDGINNKFIKKFWNFLRVPLKKYIDCCIRKGSLTSTFQNANIKLIPKKGDLAKITNWRPISLLPCMYKIISRALNNRLKKVLDKLTSRAQKGFTDKRFIQEVLINTFENVAFCKNENISGVILSIDQSKAFDSIDTEYMINVYKFFGFGEQFINIAQTICQNRSANILLENGAGTRRFSLEKGFAQGNSPSPTLYNIGEQILLFRLELDPEIASVFNHMFIPRPLVAVKHPELEEINRDRQNPHVIPWQTNKTEAFADDTNVCTLFNFDSLRTIRDTLSNFANISGLKCNYSKTKILRIGNIAPLTREILELGFEWVEEIKVLGVTISNDLGKITDNFIETEKKIDNMIKFWSKFNLTLPGRINVIKTFMLSQLGYIGSIISPLQEQLTGIQKKINKYAMGSMIVAENRLYLPLNEGGLGLISISDYLSGLQLAWIKKAFFSCRDNWRYDILYKCNGNILRLNSENFAADRHPVLFGLIQNFEKFRETYSGLNENFRKELIFENKQFFREGNRLIDRQFFSNENWNTIGNVICDMTYDDFVSNGRMKSLAEINANHNIDLSLLSYMRLGEILMTYKRKQKINSRSDGTAISLVKLFARVKKGSKIYRKYMVEEKLKKMNANKLRSVTVFYNLVGIEKGGVKVIKNNNALWGFYWLKNRVREFFFKFFNNKLGINTRVSHFVDDFDRSCDLCIASKSLPACEESFTHLFFYCTVTADLQQKFINKYLDSMANEINNTLDKKRLWFEWTGPQSVVDSQLFRIIIGIFQFTLWECKIKKRAMSFNSFMIDYFFNLKATVEMSRDLTDEKNSSNYFLCRNWDNHV